VTRYAIGLGSNVGDRLAHLERAHAALTRIGAGMVVSSLYEAAPVGGPEQGPYLNAVVALDSELDVFELLARLHEIEQQEGRERDVRWGPRTLDLDIVSSDGPPIHTQQLTVPHPRATEREFVLRPLVEVWPEAPVSDELSASVALEEVDDQDVDLLARRWLPPRPRLPAVALVAGQLAIIALLITVLWLEGSLPDRVTVSTLMGAALAVFGVGLALDASRRLGPSLTMSPLPRSQTRLVTVGSYGLVRHPIYGGIVLMAMGAGLLLGSLSALAVSLMLLAYLWVKADYEERRLRMHFAGYRAYREMVRSRLIPLVL
jgi:2-amino-4-hydroxy-6-hydroxymethyldihydropteridine diphosphokinase